MNQFLAHLKIYFGSDYMQYAIWLILAGYVAAYILAFSLARFSGTDRTILFHCRRAWVVALVVHALFVTGFTIRWFLLYGIFLSFWSYFPWYLGMLIVDAYFIFVGIISIDRYASYQQ
jgi:hypothetical protein